MAKIITIYCEGKKGSHDFDIIEKIIGVFPVTIIPIGGKMGANAIIEFNESGKTVKSDYYCMFRDRDFDCPVPASEQLTFDDKKTYFSFRTTIENYLFDTDLFFNFVKAEKIQSKYGIVSVNDVKNVFIKAAKSIKDYQSVRHALGKMRSGSASFNTTWTSGSGTLPEKLDIEVCKEKGWELISKAKNISNEWTEVLFLQYTKEFTKLFDETFFDDLKFLIYFQGKDFAKSLKNILPDFPIKKYYKFAKENFDFNKYLDLKELNNLIKINS